MSFDPQTYTDFGAALTALEERIAAAFNGLPAPGPAGPAIRTARAPIPALAANSITDVTVTWATPFVDADYTVSATVADGVTSLVNGSITRQIRSQTAGGCVIRVSNGAASQAAGIATLHVVAVHD